MNKKEVKTLTGKIEKASNLTEVKTVINENDCFKGVPYVGVKVETIKNNLIRVLNNEVTPEQLKAEKIERMQAGRKKENVKTEKKEKSKKGKKEVKTEKSKVDKKTKKLLKKLSKLETKKELKQFIEKNELTVKTKKLDVETIRDAIQFVLTGNTIKNNKHRVIQDVERTINIKKHVVSRPETVKGYIETLLLKATKKNKPISLETLFNKVFDFVMNKGEKYNYNGKEVTLKEKHRKQMLKGQNGLFTTCRVTPKVLSQTLYKVKFNGTGLNRSFIFEQ